MKIISIIPARGGSKGLINKNIIKIAGKPLITWTIEQSLKTKSIYKTYVSTNENQIANVSKQYGAEIIWRPEDICGDTATSESAIMHALDYFKEEQKMVPDYVVFLQATSPLRKRDDIEKAIKKIVNDEADSLISGSRLEDFLFWEERNGKWESVNFDYKNRGRRQNRKPQFVENGSIYILKPEILRKFNNRIGGKLTLYEMEFWQTWEIDTAADIDLIEFYLNKKIITEQII